jgi:hypothetical protein
MPEPRLVDQVATLNSTLSSVERRLTRGNPPVEGLEDFKSALDDMRLRLWGLLSAAGGGDYRNSQERFRILRTTDICLGLSGDLRSGAVSGGHTELSHLREAAADLERSIEVARQQAF